MSDYKRFINYFTPTDESVEDDFHELKTIDCDFDKLLSPIGMKILNKFFLMYKIKSVPRKGNVSIEDILKSGNMSKFSSKHPKIEDNPIENFYAQFRLYRGSFSEFRPVYAKNLYCEYKPRHILDLNAGMGGKLLGAISMEIPYIGVIDQSLVLPFRAMSKRFDGGLVKLVAKPAYSINYDTLNYDFVIYYPYDESIRLNHKFEFPEDYTGEYIGKSCELSFKHLSEGQHLVLICKKKYADEIVERGYMPKPSRQIVEPLHNRFEKKIAKKNPDNIFLVSTFTK